MHIENVTIVTRDDSIIDMTLEELKNFKGNNIVHERQLQAELDHHEVWSNLIDVDSTGTD